MQPSSNWFPTSLQERAAWYQNFSVQFGAVGGSLGFTPAEISGIDGDNGVMQFVAEAATAVDAFADAMRQYRKVTTENPVGSPNANIPTYIPPTIPEDRPTGIFERLDELVKRIRVAPSYTDEIGALLGIIPAVTTRPAPSEMQPQLKTTSLPGSLVQVKFVRGQMDGIAIEMKIDNAATWSDAGRFFSSPAELVIPQNAENLPRAVQVRARFVDGNSPVGQFSDIATTATQPAA